VLLKAKKNKEQNRENKRRNVKFLFKNLSKMAYLYGCLTS